MAKHKCCGNKTKGQVLEIKLISKTKGEYIVNFAQNSSYDRGYLDGGVDLIWYGSRRNNHSLSFDKESGVLTVYASYFASDLRQKLGFCDYFNQHIFTGLLVDTFYEKSSTKYIFNPNNTGRPIETYPLSSTGQWLVHHDKEQGRITQDSLCKEISRFFLRAGTSYNLFRGSVQEINQVANSPLYRANNYLINAVTSYTAKAHETRQCISLNLKRKDFINYDTVNFNLINTSNNIINFEYGENQDKVLSIPYNENQFYFAGWELHECGCAKGEIECTRNGKKCCINCCDVARKLHDKYLEVYS